MRIEELKRTIEQQRYINKHDLYIVAGQLQESNVDPIDSWTFFLWLQSHNIPSVYILKAEDSFYKNSIKGKCEKDIIVLSSDNLEKELLQHIDLWVRACAFVVEWDLGGIGLDYWIRDLKDCRYVFLQHGIIGTCVYDIHLYPCHNIYNDINVSSEQEKLLIEKNPNSSSCFIAGLPRYDTIKNVPHQKNDVEKVVFVFFTYRNTFYGDTKVLYSSSYWRGIMSLLSRNVTEKLKFCNIKIVLSLHHSLLKHLQNIELPNNVTLLEQQEISYWIKKADAVVTDFSSISFDFLFQEKPVIYWIPDRGDSIYAEGSSDYKKIMSAANRQQYFFNCVNSAEDVVNLLEHYATNSFVLEDEFKAIAASWFQYKKDISSRIYYEIEARLSKERELYRQSPKVSIIIPIYNAEQYIDQCLQSIILQPFYDYEIILVNDGSKDTSLDICNQYAQQNERIKIINKANGGVSSARNIGLKEAKGEYITFIDIDDYVDESFFLPLSYNPKEDIVFTQYKCFTNDGIVTEGENIDSISATQDKKNVDNYLSIWLHQNIMRVPWGKFIKRTIIGNCEFPIGQTIGEDSVFMFSVLSKIKSIKTVDNAFYMWRSHADIFMEKYQLPVDDAITYLLNIYNTYRNIGVSSPHLEATLYFTFYTLAEKSIKILRWKWFARPVIIKLWESIDFDYKNIHKKKFQKYKIFRKYYQYADRYKFISNL